MTKTQGPTIKLCQVQVRDAYLFFYQKSNSTISTPSTTVERVPTSFLSTEEASYFVGILTKNKTKKVLATATSIEQIKQNHPELYI